MKLRIELLSDLCTYSGDTFNSVVDTDVVYDRYGLPYIPARRLKGCIREACLELAELGCVVGQKEPFAVDDEIFEKLFGKEGNSDSAFSLSNACLEDYHKKTAVLKGAEGKSWMSPQKVLDLYTYTRTQTAVDLEKGTAQKNSLRTMRVVKRGLVFEAELTWNSENINEESREFQVLKAAASIVTHMGFGRTRGLGMVSLELLPEITGEETEEIQATVTTVEGEKNQGQLNGKHRITEDSLDPQYDYHRLEYQIDLESPVICKVPTGNQASTQDYIAGEKILGLLAGLIGQEDYRAMTAASELIVSNAYILCGGLRTIPARNSWKKQKDQTFDENNRMDIWEMLCEPDVSNMQMTPVKLPYVNENGVAADVDTEITYHHKRPDDKAIGRATGKDNSSFYQLESIQAEQSFGGYILADTRQAQAIIRAAGLKRRVKIGYGKNAQFGDACFRLSKAEPVKKEREKMKAAAVTLVSDVILYNHNGVPSVSTDCLKEYLQAFLGLEKEDFRIEKPYFSFTTVGGYNTTWQTFKPVIPALGKGSVFVIRAEKEFEKPEYCFIGERVMEGFGEIRFEALPENERYTLYKPAINKPSVSPENMDLALLEQLKEREEMRKLERHIRDMAGFFEGRKGESEGEMADVPKESVSEIIKLIKKNADSFGTAVAKLRMIYQSTASFEEFKAQIEQIASDETRKACKNISSCIDPDKLLKRYSIGKSKEEAYRMIYHVYLTELKYLAKIVKEKAREAKKREQSG